MLGAGPSLLAVVAFALFLAGPVRASEQEEEAVLWEKTRRLGSARACRAFLFHARNRSHAAEAGRRLERLDFEEALAANDRASLRLTGIRAAWSRFEGGSESLVLGLRESLAAPQAEIQLPAIQGLVLLRKENTGLTDDFRKAIAASDDSVVKLRLRGELANLEDPAALEDIRKLVRSMDSAERICASEVLGTTEGPGSAEALGLALEDRDPLVRIHAARAILVSLRNRRPEAAPGPPPAEGECER